MKILVNGELKFEGTEKEVLKFAKSLANERYESEVGIELRRKKKKLDNTNWFRRKQQEEKLADEILCLQKTANWPPLKIEFLN